MKKLQITSWIIFFTGIIFRLFLLPGGNLILVIGAALFLVHNIIFLIKNWASNLAISFLHLSITAWTIYLLFRILFWPGGPYFLGAPLLFLVPFLITVVYVTIHIIEKTKFRLPQILLSIYFLFSLKLAETHSHRIYYFFNLNKVLNEESRNYNYQSWDKYSWFLYISKKQDEALQANEYAQKALKNHFKKSLGIQKAKDSMLIWKHREQIENKIWNTYP